MLWLSDPLRWQQLTLKEKLQLLKKHFSGPCGQSSSVMQTQSVIQQVLNECIKKLDDKNPNSL